VRTIHLIPLLAGLLSVNGCTQPVDDDTADDDTADDDTADDDDADDDSADDDDSAAAVAELGNTRPQDGETEAYYRDPIFVNFNDPASGASVVLAEDGGAEVPGDQWIEEGRWLTFDPYGDDPVTHLTPLTDHTLTISWDGHEDVEVRFRTSATGTPLGDPESEVVGTDFLLDLGGAEITEPSVMGGVISDGLVESHLVLRIQTMDEDAGTAHVIGAAVERVGQDYVQDLCTATIPAQGGPAGTWSNPWFELGPATLVLPTVEYDAPLFELVVSASFTPDGGALDGGTLEGELDTRAADHLIDPGTEGALCEFLADFDLVCEACPEDGEPFCMSVRAIAIRGEPVSVSSVDPETGESHTHLVEVTADQVATWTAGGYCP